MDICGRKFFLKASNLGKCNSNSVVVNFTYRNACKSQNVRRTSYIFQTISRIEVYQNLLPSVKIRNLLLLQSIQPKDFAKTNRCIIIIIINYYK